MAAAVAAICASGHISPSLQDWKALSAFFRRQPVSASTSTRCGAAFGSGRVLLPTWATLTLAGSVVSQVASGKTDGFESAALLAVVRRAAVPGAARRVMRVSAPSRLMYGQLA